MYLIQILISFLGRLLLSLIFISSGIHQILDWPATEQMLTNALNEWIGLTMGMQIAQEMISLCLAHVPFLLSAAIFCKIVGGLCVLLGVQVRWGAFLLILFLIPATLLFHHFWLLPMPERQTQMAEFMKNISILGGLFLLLAYGKGKKLYQHDADSPNAP